jgi:hypothetical protein
MPVATFNDLSALGDLAQRCGVEMRVTGHGDWLDVHFFGEADLLREFATRIGFTNGETAVV